MLAVLAGASVSARAADPPNAKAPPAMAPSAPSEPGAAYPDSVTSHSLAIGGKTIAYTARAGLITLHDTDGKTTAQVFYTADTADDANPSTRPVTFIYNGGPGSSTMWLRMGSFGPVRVVAADGTASGPPPYRIVDNQYSLLDKSDLVFIDMPDSGFAQHHAGLGKIVLRRRSRRCGVRPVHQQLNLSKFNRWNSPKFIFGESYGTPRSAALSEYLVEHGVTLNGVILQSSILNFGLDYGNGDPIGGGDWPYVLYLPTEAATAWYHNMIPNRPSIFPRISPTVKQFAMGEYLDALSKGDKLGQGERDDVI